MIISKVNGLVEAFRAIVSDCLFGTEYSALTVEWDLFVTNIIVSIGIVFTIWFFWKIIFRVISFIGG